jgi:type II secretory pathway pseudopilin PulG
MKKKYLAYTLTEILLVMGVIMILGSVAVAGVRYGNQKSREAHYKSNVKLLYSVLVQFKDDYGRYILVTRDNCTGCLSSEVFAAGLGYRGRLSGGGLLPYLPERFDGGVEATYFYYVQPEDGQFVVVCTSLRGIEHNRNLNNRYYCEGDGLGILPIDDSEYDPLPTDNYIETGTPAAEFIRNRMDRSSWKNGTFSDLP